MAIQPYLFFNGRCEEALDFYKEKLGRAHHMKFTAKPAKQSALAALE